ncbi:MAG: hypothetical protein PQJ44_02965 [Sphaerochaetaceae bacterium]|nr:hypothetical protein [Sphaerochaetaceae bacterium]
MYIFIGIILIGFGIFEALNPETVLEWQDKLRIRGNRTYTGYSRIATIVSGILLILGGVTLIILQIVLFNVE